MPSFFHYCIILPMTFVVTTSAAQKADIKKHATDPKKNIELPLDYAISLPRLNMTDWNPDNKAYNHFITSAVVKTQVAMSYRQDNVDITLNTSSVLPHAQLDTSMLITDAKQLIGTWRTVSNRIINFRDSLVIESGEFLRTNELVKDQKGDDLFLKIDDKHFKLYGKTEGKNDFKRQGVRYNLESGRYLLLYRPVFGMAGASQVGIDKEGRLVLHAAVVQMRKLRYKYVVSEAVINQTVYERVNE